MKDERFFSLIRGIVRPFAAIFYPTRVVGLENIPKEGSVLLCANHVSNTDPVLLACCMRRPVSFMAKKELFGTRLTGWFFRKLGMVPVDRSANDIQALRASLEVLNEGNVLGIFPQGHRFRNDENHQIQTGAALMALRSRAAVVPVYLSHPRKPFHRTDIFIRPALDMTGMSRTGSEAIKTMTLRISSGIWQGEAQGSLSAPSKTGGNHP